MIKLYHGTSDALGIKDVIISPAQSGQLRESFRSKHLDDCYATTSLLSAQKYAFKASSRFGGNPVVFEVEPLGPISNINNNEYISTKYKVVKKLTFLKT